MLAKEIFMETYGSMQEQNFTNIISSVLRLNKTEWTLKFVREYRDKLSVKIRYDAFNYNMTVIYFVESRKLTGCERIKNPDMALYHLSKVSTQSIILYPSEKPVHNNLS